MTISKTLLILHFTYFFKFKQYTLDVVAYTIGILWPIGGRRYIYGCLSTVFTRLPRRFGGNSKALNTSSAARAHLKRPDCFAVRLSANRAPVGTALGALVYRGIVTVTANP